MDIIGTLNAIATGGDLDAEGRALREALYAAFKKMERRSRDGPKPGYLAAVKSHLTNHPSSGPSLADVKDEIDKARVKAKR